MHPVIAPLAAACSSLGGVLVSARSQILPLSTCSWGTARIGNDIDPDQGLTHAYMGVHYTRRADLRVERAVWG